MNKAIFNVGDTFQVAEHGEKNCSNHGGHWPITAGKIYTIHAIENEDSIYEISYVTKDDKGKDIKFSEHWMKNTVSLDPKLPDWF